MVFFRLLTACAPWSVTPSREALEGDKSKVTLDDNGEAKSREMTLEGDGLTSDIVSLGEPPRHGPAHEPAGFALEPAGASRRLR